MFHPVTTEDLAALGALAAGARTAKDVAARVGKDVWVSLRTMELREPALVRSEADPTVGESVWAPTDLGLEALRELT